MKLTKLHQLEALSNGTKLVDAAGRKWEVIHTPGLKYLHNKNGNKHTKMSLPKATNSYGPFHTETT